MSTSQPYGPKTCVIGAGSSGIAAAKALHERGIPFDCFEKSDRIGGNWVFGNRNGMSSAYRSLHINTSRERMEYSDFPMPKSYPDFPHHTQIAKYFDDYVDHFGFRDRIRFETGVEHVARRDDGVFEVELENGETHLYDAVIVANGHHWDARWPEPAFPGEFSGRADALARLQGRRRSSATSASSSSAWATARWTSPSTSSYAAAETYLAARRGA